MRKSKEFYEFLYNYLSIEYHDFIHFLKKCKILESFPETKTISLILIPEKIMEYHLNMMDEKNQRRVLKNHVIQDQWNLNHEDAEFLGNMNFYSKTLFVYKCNKLLLHTPSLKLWNFLWFPLNVNRTHDHSITTNLHRQSSTVERSTN